MSDPYGSSYSDPYPGSYSDSYQDQYTGQYSESGSIEITSGGILVPVYVSGGTLATLTSTTWEPPDTGTNDSAFDFLDDFNIHIAIYEFVVGMGAPQVPLSKILEPQLEFNLQSHNSVSFKLNELDEAARQIDELITDLWVYRDKDFIFRGRIGPSQDDLSPDGGYAAFTAVDYRAILTSRKFLYDEDLLFWFDEDVSVLAHDMLATVQARVGGSLLITEGVGFPACGVVRSEVEVTPGTSVGAVLDRLQESKIRGFDWEVDPLLAMNIWPKRGVNPAEKYLEMGGAISKMTRNYKTDEFSNAVRASGGEATYPQVVEAAGLPSDPRGRWEKEVSWPDEETQEVMEDRVEYLLEQVNRVPQEYAVTLKQGFWKGRTHLWLGDGVIMPINYGRLNSSEALRIHSVKISIDGNGQEELTLAIK